MPREVVRRMCAEKVKRKRVHQRRSEVLGGRVAVVVVVRWRGRRGWSRRRREGRRGRGGRNIFLVVLVRCEVLRWWWRRRGGGEGPRQVGAENADYVMVVDGARYKLQVAAGDAAGTGPDDSRLKIILPVLGPRGAEVGRCAATDEILNLGVLLDMNF